MSVSRDELAPDGAKRTVYDWWMALSGGRFDEVVTYLAEDVTWEIVGLQDYLPFGGVWSGKEHVVGGILSLFQQVYDVNNLAFDITAMYQDGSTVVMEFTVNAMTTRGRPYYGVRYVSVVRVKQGKIHAIREYSDTLRAKLTLLD